MRILALFISAVLVSNTVFALPLAPIPVTPDQKVTPGEYCDEKDKDFDSYRYSEKMPYCKRNVSKSIKRHIYEVYHIPPECHARYTVDHFVPLALGGNNATENLWPEHKLVKATRQKMEQDLYNKVSQGLMNSDDATYILLKEKTNLILDLSHVDGCG